MISTDLFPYENHPYRLEFGEGKNATICWFECEEHLQKHLTRYKIDTKVAKIDYRDEKPIKPSKKHKRSVEQTPKPKSNGGSGTVRKRKSSVDSTRNTTGPTKRKK
jgi:hypothetical protein